MTGRYSQCDDTCTTDCGHCKGAGRPATVDLCASERATDAAERGQGICGTCLAPIWNEGGTVLGQKRETGWSDRIERGGDSLVCFKAIDYRHVPLTGREAYIYDHAYKLGAAMRPAPDAPETDEGVALRQRFIQAIDEADAHTGARTQGESESAEPFNRGFVMGLCVGASIAGMDEDVWASPQRHERQQR